MWHNDEATKPTFPCKSFTTPLTFCHRVLDNYEMKEKKLTYFYKMFYKLGYKKALDIDRGILTNIIWSKPQSVCSDIPEFLRFILQLAPSTFKSTFLFLRCFPKAWCYHYHVSPWGWWVWGDVPSLAWKVNIRLIWPERLLPHGCVVPPTGNLLQLISFRGIISFNFTMMKVIFITLKILNTVHSILRMQLDKKKSQGFQNFCKSVFLVASSLQRVFKHMLFLPCNLLTYLKRKLQFPDSIQKRAGKKSCNCFTKRAEYAE